MNEIFFRLAIKVLGAWPTFIAPFLCIKAINHRYAYCSVTQIGSFDKRKRLNKCSFGHFDVFVSIFV